MKSFRLPIYEHNDPKEEGFEAELICFNEYGTILSWEMRSIHCGGLVEQDLKHLKERWPASWKRMLEKVEDRLTELNLNSYNNMIQEKVESLIDQDKDNKISRGESA